MSGTLARVTDFVPATPILSGEVDSEFNQLVNLLNGTSSAVKGVIKVSDAGDPPLELNQLSTGPILKGFQAGVENFRVRNNGGVRTPGIYDSNDNEELLFVATASAVNEFTCANAAAGGRPKLSATGGDANIGIDIIPKGSGVVKIQAGAPVAGADAANKDYVDGRHTLWSASFFVADVAARGVDVNSDNIQRALVPGANFTATHIFLCATSGTNTGTFSMQVIKTPFSGAAGTVLGTVSWNPGGGDTLNVGKEVDIADHVFTANDFIQVNITAASSPLQKAVIVGARGFQTPV
jgi:hypothetical protein